MLINASASYAAADIQRAAELVKRHSPPLTRLAEPNTVTGAQQITGASEFADGQQAGGHAMELDAQSEHAFAHRSASSLQLPRWAL